MRLVLEKEVMAPGEDMQFVLAVAGVVVAGLAAAAVAGGLCCAVSIVCRGRACPSCPRSCGLASVRDRLSDSRNLTIAAGTAR